MSFSGFQDHRQLRDQLLESVLLLGLSHNLLALIHYRGHHDLLLQLEPAL
jgi:hypothetical protein